MGKCDDHHCSTQGHDHHHHHQHGSCCGAESCCCCGGQDECHDHLGDFASDLLELADEAWMCLLKDKIKEQILATNGKHLDELAKLVAGSNNERWKLKMAKKNTMQGFRAKMESFFSKEK